MSHFYATVKGSSKAPADRRGSKDSGVSAELSTRQATLRLALYHKDGRDFWNLQSCDRRGKVTLIAAGNLDGGWAPLELDALRGAELEAMMRAAGYDLQVRRP